LAFPINVSRQRIIITTKYDPTDDLDDGWSSDESLAELEGDELEANSQALHEEAKSWNAPTAFKVMMAPKDANDWKKAKANHALYGCSETGKEVQLHKIQISQAYPGERRLCS
jgi:hypothetical protein